MHLVGGIDPDETINRDEKGFYFWNLVSEYYCDIYIGTLLILSWHTFSKLKIETKIYY